ncbi:hypothetical protein MMPV_006976 [Pyropia vietnamensis]
MESIAARVGGGADCGSGGGGSGAGIVAGLGGSSGTGGSSGIVGGAAGGAGSGSVGCPPVGVPGSGHVVKTGPMPLSPRHSPRLSPRRSPRPGGASAPPGTDGGPPDLALPPPAGSGAGAATIASRSPSGPPPLAPSEPLWVRRQLFEHAVTVPLLPGVVPGVEWGGLAAALRTAAAGESAEGVEEGQGRGGGGGASTECGGAVTEAAWARAAAFWMQLDTAAAAVVVEELAANIPEAFARVNPGAGVPVAPFPVLGTTPDGAAAAAPPPPPTRCWRIPVPELLAFLRLHAAAKGMAATYRATANAVWPDAVVPATHPPGAAVAAAATVAPGGAPNGAASPGGGGGAPGAHFSGGGDAGHTIAATPSLVPPDGGAEPLVAAATPGASGGGGGGGTSPGLSGGEHTPTHRPKGSPTGQHHRHMAHSAIVASDANARERETQLVAACLGDLLLLVAAAYGVVIDTGGGSPVVGPVGGSPGGGGNGSSSSSSGGGGSSSSIAGGGVATASSPAATATVLCATAAASVSPTAAALPVRRAWFDHLSFLLATVAGPSAADAIAAWRSDPDATLALGPLLATVAAGLARPVSDATPGLQAGGETADRVVEVRSLERRTLLRRWLLTGGAGGKAYASRPRVASRGGGGGDAAAPVDGAVPVADSTALPDVRVSDCSDAHIYLLCPVRRLTFVACTDVTLFVAAATSLSVLSCERVAVHAASRRLLITNTFNSTLYMAVNAAPMVVGDSRGLRFAPYNAVYPTAELSAAAVAAGVDGTVNAWRDYRSPPPKGGGYGPGAAELAEAGVATVVPPDELIPFSVPTLEAEVGSREGGGVGGGEADSPPRNVLGAAPVAEGTAAGAVAAATSATMGTVPPGIATRDLRPSLLAVAAPLPAEYRASLERRVEEFEALRRVVCSFELRPVGGAGGAVAPAAPALTLGGEVQTGAPTAAAGLQSKVDAGRPSGATADMTAAPAEASAAAAAAGPAPTPNCSSVVPPPTASVHSLVTAHFREWLSSSNNMRQLQELVALTPEQQLQ